MIITKRLKKQKSSFVLVVYVVKITLKPILLMFSFSIEIHRQLEKTKYPRFPNFSTTILNCCDIRSLYNFFSYDQALNSSIMIKIQNKINEKA